MSQRPWDAPEETALAVPVDADVEPEPPRVKPGAEILRELETADLKGGPPGPPSRDAVRVHATIREGDRERIQIFEGILIAMKHGGNRRTITVRKTSFGVAVERIFPLHSPLVAKVEVVRSHTYAAPSSISSASGRGRPPGSARKGADRRLPGDGAFHRPGPGIAGASGRVRDLRRPRAVGGPSPRPLRARGGLLPVARPGGLRPRVRTVSGWPRFQGPGGPVARRRERPAGARRRVPVAGVHLPEAGLAVAAVRARFPRGRLLIGRSVHGVDAAAAAEADGADYVILGPVAPTGGKRPCRRRSSARPAGGSGFPCGWSGGWDPKTSISCAGQGSPVSRRSVRSAMPAGLAPSSPAAPIRGWASKLTGFPS